MPNDTLAEIVRILVLFETALDIASADARQGVFCAPMSLYCYKGLEILKCI